MPDDLQAHTPGLERHCVRSFGLASITIQTRLALGLSCAWPKLCHRLVSNLQSVYVYGYTYDEIT